MLLGVPGALSHVQAFTGSSAKVYSNEMEFTKLLEAEDHTTPK